MLIEDVAVPRSRLPEMFRAIEEIGARYGIEIPTIAHAGDGNLHPNFVFAGRRGAREVWAAADEHVPHRGRLGGTLTGEHGVGHPEAALARRRARRRLVELQRGHQGAVRPAGILNPGVMFEPPPGIPAAVVGAAGRIRR